MSIVEIKIPSPGESITEVEIGSWLKADGDYVQLDETICEIETDKATLPLIAESAGALKIILQEGETAGIGDVACSIDTEAAQPETSSAEISSATSETADSPEQSVSTTDSYAAGHPSPAARKMMAEQGIANVTGGGPGGRITKEDVRQHERQVPEAVTTAESAQQAEAPEVSGSRNKKRERLSRLRRKLAERLVAVKNETAMLTTFNEVDMQAIFDLRSQSKDLFLEKHKVKLGFMGLFTKACTEALKYFPVVNAQLDGDEIVFHDYVDMGIAVSAPKGLMVPVVRNAESLTLPQIETEIGRLAKRARDNKLSIDEMEGGTFSITNGGVFGSMLSTPILNPPQSAILGMHNIVERPMAVNGKVVIRPVMYLALSYDHRIVDGQQSVSFLVRVRENLENPTRMLL
ncbi:2-oxoglutarate dehydrogenase complex dihydrolipoyllysine-residue succinyltransferase [bacterium]|jgi:2-oxoglutarate dehydrogenase E2 component (dihydrolipoamide succinyltransferase)|nr:2-oxoglutarate dehydrogenase complex dihydrolipoyllysine-residue succinyltransferase [bacterium]